MKKNESKPRNKKNLSKYLKLLKRNLELIDIYTKESKK